VINNIVVGISQALYEGFGYKSYIDTVAQGLKGPCFFIRHLSGNQQHKIGIRYEQSVDFDIHYFPQSESSEEFREVEQKLYDILEYISTEDGVYRAEDMSGEVHDGVLHFLVGYRFFVLKKKSDVDKMDTAAVTVSKKESEGNG
jgi:hypothetical protein